MQSESAPQSPIVSHRRHYTVQTLTRLKECAPQPQIIARLSTLNLLKPSRREFTRTVRPPSAAIPIPTRQTDAPSPPLSSPDNFSRSSPPSRRPIRSPDWSESRSPPALTEPLASPPGFAPRSRPARDAPKVRIARGPDLALNFASRRAYATSNPVHAQLSTEIDRLFSALSASSPPLTHHNLFSDAADVLAIPDDADAVSHPSNGHAQHKSTPEFDSPPLAQSEDASTDALSKWFGSIHASAENALREEELVVDSPSKDEQDKREELDSNVLSFFDNIRSQALSSQSPFPAGTAPPAADRFTRVDASPSVPGLQRRKDISQTDLEKLKETQVENFFQLFTEGSPTEGTNHLGTQEPNGIRIANGLLSEPPPEQVDRSRIDSDNRGLERWFAALATGSSLE